MCSRFWDNMEILERITLRILALLGDYDRSALFQASDLAIDMQHLRLKERRAIGSDNRT